MQQQEYHFCQFLLPILPARVRLLQPLNDDLNTTTNITTTTTTTNSTILEQAEEEHEYDAVTSLLLNVTIIVCLLLAYYVRKFRIYYLPESAGALIVGMVVGGMARISTEKLKLFEFSPEVFFFVLLPPIIFEAGYSLNRKDFFENIGAITLYAMVGTIISTFVVGGLSNAAASVGLIQNVDQSNPMEALLFGALISAVDPVATLSIMGNAELNCDPLLYSLVFGESVLNDAIAISLFRVFAKFYKPEGPDWYDANIPQALLSFGIVSLLSIAVGVGLGLAASFLYKHTSLHDYPNLETSLLFSFCYLCYATGESLGLSGIMALFFQGIVLSHYNSYNLSPTAHVASEQIFATLATIAETAVFLYMGMGTFTGRFENYDFLFSFLAMMFCFLGRALNIFPLSFLANLCRSPDQKISIHMQCVLWFAGLRGAIAFALAMNMPGPNREVYATATLSICIFTTVVCGGMTEGMLTTFGMKQRGRSRGGGGGGGGINNDDDDTDNDDDDEEVELKLNRVSYKPATTMHSRRPSFALRTKHRMYNGAKRIWKQLDDEVLKPYFGGSNSSTTSPTRAAQDSSNRGHYELGNLNSDEYDDDDNDNDNDDDDDDDDNNNSLNNMTDHSKTSDTDEVEMEVFGSKTKNSNGIIRIDSLRTPDSSSSPSRSISNATYRKTKK